MAVDEATANFLQQMAESGFPPIHEMSPEEARGLTAAMNEMYGPGPEVARVEDTAVTSGGTSVPLRVLVPHDEPRGLLVYYHGGGWVIGALDEFDHLGRKLAQATGCAVVLVDYRLAPEHRYPAAVEDAWAALEWAGEHVEQIAGGRVPLIVSGDSAGGNLATIVARRARDAGGPQVSLQVLVYPVTDSDVDRPSYTDPENQLMLSRDGMIWFFDHYAPDRDVRREADLSPLHTADLSGLPPAVVALAEHDVLRDEGAAYADKLREAGVPVEQRLFDGQMHGFFTLVNILPGSQAGIDYVAEQVERHFAALPA